MIQSYNIGERPISFQAKTSDLIEVNEKSKSLIFIALLVVNVNDKIETTTGEETVEEATFQNTYTTAQKIEVPYENVNFKHLGIDVTLFDFITEKVSDGNDFSLDFVGEVAKQSTSKIECKNISVISSN